MFMFFLNWVEGKFSIFKMRVIMGEIVDGCMIEELVVVVIVIIGILDGYIYVEVVVLFCVGFIVWRGLMVEGGL